MNISREAVSFPFSVIAGFITSSTCSALGEDSASRQFDGIKLV
jgi:hypothetical protein